MRTVLFAAVVAIAGCGTVSTTTKTWTATGGSRGDGTVELTYWHGLWENVNISVTAGIPIAAQRCKAWGYETAEPFGSSVRKCNQAGQYGCIEYIVTATFQCLTPIETGGAQPARIEPPGQEAGSTAATPAAGTATGYAPKPKQLPKNDYTAGKLARTLGCSPPALISMSDTSETFQAACPGGQHKIIQCEFSNCRVLQ